MIGVVVACLGWILAGVLGGLWWGERGRRIDIAWFVGAMRPPGMREPSPVTKDRIPTEEEEAVGAIEEQAVYEAILDQAAAKGVVVSEDDAREDARQMVQKLRGGAGI